MKISLIIIVISLVINKLSKNYIQNNYIVGSIPYLLIGLSFISIIVNIIRIIIIW